ncbi:MAG: hypothetical protein Edafosvirus1_118 [Edafosvirus sp.]|uniref:Uncharacterized protein n=1 Tax=Edafosvirus sp. TaxID=2487765 RepID=A0A3G4ZSB8_9VIRU|nr:MAG: hypothetical protein Edafosvirus1_118 [Edafosvirus sp.]
MPKKTSAPKKVLDAKKAAADAEKEAKSKGARKPGTETGSAKTKGKPPATKGSGVKAGEYKPS